MFLSMFQGAFKIYNLIIYLWLSVNIFLKEYNKTHGYSLIFSNTGFDNLLYADSAFNITKEIVDGLNARYSPAANK